MSDLVIQVEDLVREYDMGAELVLALRGVTLANPAQRVRRDHGPVGFRQVHLHEPAGLPRHSDWRELLAQRPGSHPACRTTPWPGSATGKSGSCSRPSTCCPAPPRCTTSSCRWCTPEYPSGERRRRAEQALDPGRPGQPDGAPAQRTVGRPAPAGGDRPGAGEPPVPAPGRRADRQPRQHHQRGDHGGLRRAAQPGPDHHRRDPRALDRRSTPSGSSSCATAASTPIP